MAADPDALLLDRLFQPIADRFHDRIACFGLARLALGAAVALQTVVLALDLAADGEAVTRTLTGAATALAYVGADQARGLIARAERQSRPGVMNLRRVTLRWQRMAWLAVASCSAASSLGSLAPASLCSSAACLAWLATIYFVSCSTRPPSARSFQRFAFAGAA